MYRNYWCIESKNETAPADIFIYGVHKSTEVGDIIEDLVVNQINVNSEDIKKKTCENASLDCTRFH